MTLSPSSCIGRSRPQFCSISQAKFTKAELIARLDGSGLPFAPIGKPEDLFDDPHLLASGGLARVTLDDGRATLLPVLPIELAGQRTGAGAVMPKAGADTEAVLAALGLTPAEIAAAIASGSAARA